ncbi:MAG: hypothetical protein Q7R39_15935 [Dehalococcoidia bacterium]|nr:hypothetical protein [Dehalococcoidia bacterium]
MPSFPCAEARGRWFGSHGPFCARDSDLDFLVEFASPGPVGVADRYFGLLESLEALFGRPVDLVVASTIKNPYFRESLSSTRTLFSGRKEPIKVGLLKAMLRKAGPAEEEFTGLLEGGK